VFWPVGSEFFTATSFLLICLAVFDNIMLSLYYLLIGIPNTCGFYNTCQIFMKVDDVTQNVFTHQVATLFYVKQRHGQYLESIYLKNNQLVAPTKKKRRKTTKTTTTMTTTTTTTTTTKVDDVMHFFTFC